jgi:hypothetical protein
MVTSTKDALSVRPSLTLGIVLLLLLSLMGHLAGRYASVTDSSGSAKAFASQINPKHQHLDRDGMHWNPPPSDFTVFVAAVCGARVAPPSAPVLVVHLDDSLYNRPPPVA